MMTDKTEVHIYPLNQVQKEIFFEFFNCEDKTAQNFLLLLKIDSWIDMQRLKEAFVSSVKNHEFLNTRIVLNEKKEPGFYKGEGFFSLQNIEEIHEDSKNIEEIQDSLEKPFELINSPLFSIKFIYAKGVYVLVEVHKIICDLQSLYIFMEDVSQAYLSYELEKEKINGYDAIIQEIENSSAKSKEASKSYFETIIKDGGLSSLPRGDCKKTKNKKMCSLELVSRRCITDMVRSFCQINKVSMDCFFKAVFGFLLAKYNACRKAVFSNVYDGRSDSSFDYTVSRLARLFPLFVNTGGKSIIEYIKDVESQVVSYQKNLEFSITEIEKEFGVKSEILFLFKDEKYNFASFCGKISKLIKLKNSEGNNSLVFQISLHGAEVTYNIDYNSDLYSQKYIEYFADAFDMVVGEFLVKEALREVETTSYKAVKALKGFNDVNENAGRLQRSEKSNCFNFLNSETKLKIYILDDFGKLLPIGAFGRLYIASSCVKLLVKNSALTEKELAVNPFDYDLKQMIETDITARWLPDGCLEIL